MNGIQQGMHRIQRGNDFYAGIIIKEDDVLVDVANIADLSVKIHHNERKSEQLELRGIEKYGNLILFEVVGDSQKYNGLYNAELLYHNKKLNRRTSRGDAFVLVETQGEQSNAQQVKYTKENPVLIYMNIVIGSAIEVGAGGSSSTIEIGGNGNWWIDGVDTGKPSKGNDGETPIIKNGNWWIGNADTGVKARGEDGHSPTLSISEPGTWVIDGVDTGKPSKGEDGQAGEKGKNGDPGEKGDPGEDGESFQIKKIYPTVAAMNADFATTSVKFGEVVLIKTASDTDPDNGKQYVKGASSWGYIGLIGAGGDSSGGLVDANYPESSWLKGHFINKTGVVVDSPNYAITDYIDISDYSKVQLKGNIDYGAIQNNVSFYSDAKVFVSGWNIPSTTTGADVSINIPGNASYMRLSNKVLGLVDPSKGGYLNFAFTLTDIASGVLAEKYAPTEKPKRYFFTKAEGYIRSSDGGATTSGASIWGYTPDFIPVTPGMVYYFSGVAQVAASGINTISFYQRASEGTYMKGISAPISGNEKKIYTREPITIPNNCQYMRFSGNLNDLIKTFEFEGTDGDLFNLLQRESQTVESESVVPANSFAVPAFIDFVVGRPTDLFLDGLTSEPDGHNQGALLVNSGANPAILRRGKSIRWTPTGAQTIPMTFTKADVALNPLFSSTSTFRSVSKTNGTGAEKNICIAGDSLVASGVSTTEMYKLLKEDNDFAINQVGTITTVESKHEGRSSWLWSTYVNPLHENTPFAGTKNAFMIGGKLDFKKYMQNNFPDLARKEIDCFVMSLGTNDVTQGISLPSNADLNKIITDCKKFIDAFFSAETGFPNAKMALGLCGCGAEIFPSANTQTEIFKRAIQLLNQRYIKEFDNGKYHPNLTCVMHGAYIDRYNAYPYVDEPVNDLLPAVMVRRFTNSVHPTDAGFRLWGRGYYGKVRAWLNNLL